MHRCVWIIVLTGFLGIAPPGRGEVAAAPAEAMPDLIGQLSNPDPAVREQAERRLVKLGGDARDALRTAAESDDPELAGRARQLLLELPHTRPGDGPQVREVLGTYGRMPPEARRRAIQTLIELKQHAPVARVLFDEPSDGVRWYGVGQLLSQRDAELAGQWRDLDLKHANSAILVLAGYGWLDTDPDRASELFHQAMQLEAREPTYDEYEILDGVVDLLVVDAINRRDYDQAAALLRQQITRGRSATDPYGAVGRLFALHAAYGPLVSYGSDVAAYGSVMHRPTVLDPMTSVLAAIGMPLRTMAMASHAMSDAPQTERFGAAELMYRVGRLPLAEFECKRILELTGPLDPQLDLMSAYRLAYIVGQQGRDEEAAKYLERVVAIQASGHVRLWSRTDGDLTAEIHWRRLRAARDRGDTPAMQRELQALLEAPASHADVALDIIPALEQLGRQEEADRYFETVRQVMDSRRSADPTNPEHMNNLAWLYARSGRRLDEALALSTRAVELAPESAAFLDTAAEANFRVGNFAEAVRLEQRAVARQPDDKFMHEQLARFRKALEKQTSGAPQ